MEVLDLARKVACLDPSSAPSRRIRVADEHRRHFDRSGRRSAATADALFGGREHNRLLRGGGQHLDGTGDGRTADHSCLTVRLLGTSDCALVEPDAEDGARKLGILRQVLPDVAHVRRIPHADVEVVAVFAESRRMAVGGEMEELRERHAVLRLPHAVRHDRSHLRSLRRHDVRRVAAHVDVERTRTAEVDLRRLHVVVLVDRAVRGPRAAVARDIGLYAFDQIEHTRPEPSTMRRPDIEFQVLAHPVSDRNRLVLLGYPRRDVAPRHNRRDKLAGSGVPAPLFPLKYVNVILVPVVLRKAEQVILERHECHELARLGDSVAVHPCNIHGGRAIKIYPIRRRQVGRRVRHPCVTPVRRRADSVSCGKELASELGNIPGVCSVIRGYTVMPAYA